MASASHSTDDTNSLRGAGRLRVCKRCKFTTSDAKLFSFHQLNAHRRESTDIHICEECDFSTASYTDWQRHRRSHGFVSPMKSSGSPISMADEDFQSAAAPEARMDMEEEEQIDEDTTANSRRSLPTRNYTCQQCFAATTSAKQHLRHLVDVHGLNITIYECHMCEYATRWKHKLPRHIKCHFAGMAPRSPAPRSKSPRSPRMTSLLDQNNTDATLPSSKNGIDTADLRDDLGMDTFDVSGTPSMVDSHMDYSNLSKELLQKERLQNREEFGDSDGSLVVHLEEDQDQTRERSEKPANNATQVAPVRRQPVREAVDPARYVELDDPVNGTRYSCSLCGNVYKWRKSLNKHWKDKHEGEVPVPNKCLPVLSVPKMSQPTSTKYNQDFSSVKSSTPASESNISRVPYERQYGSSSVLYGDSPSWEAESYKDSLDSSYYMSVSDSMFSDNRSATESYTGHFDSSKEQLQSRRLTPIYNKNVRAPSSSRQVPKSSESMWDGPSNVVTGDNSDVQSESSYTTHTPDLYQPPKIKVERDGDDEEAGGVLDLSVKPSKKPQKSSVPVKEVKQEVTEYTQDDDDLQDEPLDLCVRKPSKTNNGVAKTENPWSQGAGKSSTGDKTQATRTFGWENTDHLLKQSDDETAPLPFAELQCSKCAYICRDKKEYAIHMELHLPVRAQRCGECKQSFHSIDELNLHFSSHHKQAILGVGDCSADSDDAASMSGSTRASPDTTPRRCYVCAAMVPTDYAIIRHFEIMHPSLPNPYRKRESRDGSPAFGEPYSKRVKASTKLSSASELMKHLLPKTNEGLFECTECTFRCKTEGQMAVHMKNLHQMQMSTSSQTSENKTNSSDAASLELGSIVFPQRQVVTQSSYVPTSTPLTVSVDDMVMGSPSPGHQEYENREGSLSPRSKSGNSEMLLPYKCSVCEYRARWPSEITQHMKNHSDEKPFLCPGCPYRSKWKWDVVKHMKRCKDALGGTIDDVIDTSSNADKRRRKYAPRKRMMTEMDNIYKPLSRGPPNVVVMPNSDTPTSVFHHQSSSLAGGHQASQYPSIMRRLEMKQESLGEYGDEGERAEYDDGMDTPPMDLHQETEPRGGTPSGLSPNAEFISTDVTKEFIAAGHNDLDDEMVEPGQIIRQEMFYDRSEEMGTGSFMDDQALSLTTHPSTPPPGGSRSSEGQSPRSGMKKNLAKSPGSSNQHPCRYCLFVGQSPAELKRHSAVHSDEKPFACDDCDYRTKWKCDLKKHMRIYNHSSKCIISLKRLNSLKQSSPESRKVQRQLDLYSRSSPQELQLLKCDKCEYVTYKKTAMDSHQRIHQSREKKAKGLKCRQCGFEARDLPSFLQHNLQHSAESKPESNFSSTKAAARKGMPVPMLGSPAKHRRKPQAILRCPKCPYTCTKKTGLDLHIGMHKSKGSSALTCQYCDYNVFSKDLLIQHMQLHREYRFDLASKLDGVEQERVPKVPLESATMVKDFQQDSDKVGSVQSKQTLRCNKCPYATNHRFKYDKHLQLHVKRSRYMCEWCDFSVDRLNSLYRHARAVHRSTLTRNAAYYEGLGQTLSDDASRQEDEFDTPDMMDEDENDDLMAPEQEDNRNTPDEKNDSQTVAMETKFSEQNNNVIESQDKDSELTQYENVRIGINTGETSGVKDNTLIQRAVESSANNETENTSIDELGDGGTEEDTNDQVADVKEVGIDEQKQMQSSSDQCPTVNVEGKVLKVLNNDSRTYYQCSLCSYSSVNSTNAKNHIRNHGTKKKFPCEYCDYGSDQLRHIITHINTIHTDQMNDAVDKYNAGDAVDTDVSLDDIDTNVPHDNSESVAGDTMDTEKSEDQSGNETDEAKTETSHEMQEKERETDQVSTAVENDETKKEIGGTSVSDDKPSSEGDKEEDVPEVTTKVQEQASGEKDMRDLSGTSISIEDSVVEQDAGPQQCAYCPFRVNDTVHFHRHMEMHEYKGRFTCKYCNYSLDHLNLLIQHMKVHSDSYTLSTDCLEERATSLADVDKAAMLGDDRKSADDRYQELISRLQESSSHRDVPMFSMSSAPSNALQGITKKLKKKAVLGKVTRSRIVYRCSLCPFTSGSKSNMHKHKNAHLVKNKYQCDLCTYSSRKWTLLLLHQKAHKDAITQSGSPEKCRYITIDPHDLVNEEKAQQKNEPKSEHPEPSGVGQETTNFIQNTQTQPINYKTSPTTETNTVRSLLLAPKQNVNLRPIAPKPVHMDELNGLGNWVKKKKKQRYHCDNCPYGSNSLFEFQKHTQLHGAALRYRCEYCDYSLDRMNLMFQHRKLHADLPGFVRNPPAKALLNHTTEADNPYVNRMDTDMSRMMKDEHKSQLDHASTPQDLSTGSNGSNFVTGSQRALLAEGQEFAPNLDHVAKSMSVSVQGKKPKVWKMYKCPLCPFSCGSKQGYSIHERLHNTDGKYKCDKCSYSVNRLNLLCQHMKLHQGIPKSVKIASDKKPLRCPKCPFRTHSPLVLSSHLRMHTSGGKYTCQFCDYSIDRYNLIKQHVKIHLAASNDGETVNGDEEADMFQYNVTAEDNFDATKRIYRCERCPFETSDDIEYGDHMDAHSVKYKFVCSYCDYSSDSKDLVAAHTSLHFPGGRISRPTNSNHNSIGGPDSLYDGIDTEAAGPSHDQYPFEEERSSLICKFCDRAFTDRSQVEKHERLHLIGCQ